MTDFGFTGQDISIGNHFRWQAAQAVGIHMSGSDFYDALAAGSLSAARRDDFDPRQPGGVEKLGSRGDIDGFSVWQKIDSWHTNTI